MKQLILFLLLFCSISFGQSGKSVLTQAQKDSIGAMIRDSSGYVTPETYGAIPDGTTDCTDALNKSAIRGKEIRLAANSEYYITGTITIGNNKLVGNNTTITLSDTSNCDLLNILGSDTSGFAIISGINFRMNGSEHSTINRSSNYTYGSAMWNVSITKCNFYNNAGHAINLQSPYNCVIENNIFYGALDDAYIRVHSGRGNTIRNNKLYKPFDYGITVDSKYNIIEGNLIDSMNVLNSVGIALLENGAHTAYGNTISNNRIIGDSTTTVYGISCASETINKGNSFISNEFELMTAAFTGQFNNDRFIANRVYNSTRGFSGSFSNSIITSNEFNKVSRSIYLTYGSHSTISSNIFTDCSEYTVRLLGVDYMTLIGNSFYDNYGVASILVSDTSKHNILALNNSSGDDTITTYFILESDGADSNKYYLNLSKSGDAVATPNIHSFVNDGSGYFNDDSVNLASGVFIIDKDGDINLSTNLKINDNGLKLELGIRGQYITSTSSSPDRSIRYDAPGSASGWYGTHDFYTGYNGDVSALALQIKNGILYPQNDIDVSGEIKIDGTKVLGNRIVGWTDPTGTADKSTFATATVTTEDLAEFVKALYEDLKTQGIIGN